ncbi:methyltransferase regulatory domain-containing protein [Derxia gummosa]|uniref:Methyltransferase regulatory domain-containing protein n=1 Tax=Derxia gummosa DSM 723 TaxID=1121388 RepID=A0A8B6XA09_9BURK|nr:class I SAM-dependent methyltransferase [Derxia gummosa]
MTTPPATDPNGYDDVPYRSQAFVQTHPDRLATLACVFGLNPPDVATCRVLELGCAAGGNLIPLAVALPGAQFVGVDLSQRQVEEGQAAIRKLGLTNVRIEHASIMDIDASWGEFDYLVCHGVFSWIPPEVQDKVLDLAARSLGPEGVAYISYNTFPGWHLRGSVRHLLGYTGDASRSPAERVAGARATLRLMLDAVPADGNAYGRQLRAELEQLDGSPDWYLFHEHLEPNNAPMWFHEFVERAGRHGLQYLAEADFQTMLPTGLPPETVAKLQETSADVVQFEQKLDFLRNRHFRQTLLCKADREVQRGLAPTAVAGMWIASAAQFEPAAPGADAGAATPASATPADAPRPPLDLRPGVPAAFALRQGERVTARGGSQNPLTKAALGLLAERWPLGWRFDELVAAAAERAGQWVPPALAGVHARLLTQELMQAFVGGLVELRAWQPPCAVAAPGRPLPVKPVASPWARHEAEGDELVTNLRHDVIKLVPFSRALLGLLDGTRDRADLVRALDARVADGSLALPQTPEPPADPQLRRAHVAAWVDDSLARLAGYSLLMG